MEKRVDNAVCMTAAVAVVVFLLWVTVPVLRWGLSHADDAFFASIAKNIATGKGYGWAKSSDEFLLMDPFVNSTGPALILPIALLIRVFGPVPYLPGTATLVIFMGQLVITAFILSRRFGWLPTCGFLSVVLWLLILLSAADLYFGVFVGETVAFGYVLIGTALLATVKRTPGVAAAALCFGLAYLTKQISLFAVGGIVVAWLIVSLYEGAGRALTLRRLAILVFVGATLPILFEASKLVTLGFDGYKQMFTATLGVTGVHAIGTGHNLSRLTTFMTVLQTSYTRPIIIVMFAAVSAVLLALTLRYRDKAQESVGRFTALAWSGAATYLAYILMFSILWPRYFWIGIAMLLIAVSATLLPLRGWYRVAAIISVLVVAMGLGLHHKLLLVRVWIDNNSAAAERVAVLKILDNHRELPYASLGPQSLFDVLYQRKDEGKWTGYPNASVLADTDFIFVINDVFTDKETLLVKAVVQSCQSLTPDARVISAFRCTKGLWANQNLTLPVR